MSRSRLAYALNINGKDETECENIFIGCLRLVIYFGLDYLRVSNESFRSILLV
jgi:hypothetical protein